MTQSALESSDSEDSDEDFLEQSFSSVLLLENELEEQLQSEQDAEDVEQQKLSALTTKPYLQFSTKSHGQLLVDPFLVV